MPSKSNTAISSSISALLLYAATAAAFVVATFALVASVAAALSPLYNSSYWPGVFGLYSNSAILLAPPVILNGTDVSLPRPTLFDWPARTIIS